MKIIPIALEGNYQDSPSTAYILKITRNDNSVYAFTSAFEDVKSEDLGEDAGETYISSQGLLVSGLVNTSGFAVDNTELMTFDDQTLFTKQDVYNGKWANAKFVLSRYNWCSPSDGKEVIFAGTLGQISYENRNSLKIELRGLQQYLQQPMVSAVTSATCRARLGDSLCTVPLASYTETGSLTSVTSKYIFADSSRTEADNWYNDGIITFTSGANEGASHQIKNFASGIFTTILPIYVTPSVSDTYEVVAGCLKRLSEDCFAKFDNVLNFQGEPHLPGVDKMMEVKR